MLNGLIAIFLALFVFAGVQTFRLNAAQEEIARDKLQAAEAIAAAQAHAREVETQWADGTRKAAETYARNLDIAKRGADGARSELDSLRDVLAAAPGGTPADPIAASRADEAARARYVVGQLAGAAAKVAAAADECEARLEGLQDYVKAITKPQE